MQWTLEELSAIRKKKRPNKRENIPTGSKPQSPKVNAIESASSEASDSHGKSKKGKKHRQVLMTDLGFLTAASAVAGVGTDEETAEADEPIDVNEFVDDDQDGYDSDAQDTLGVGPSADYKQVDKRTRVRIVRADKNWHRVAKSGFNDMAVADFMSLA
jgi:hypothetical protein